MRLKKSLLILAALVAVYLFVLNAGVHLGLFKNYVQVCKQGADSECQYQSTYSIYYFPIRWVIRVCAYFSGLITAVAGGAVAFFTLALWRSTDRLWTTSERQSIVLKTQTEILRKQLIAQRPDLGYSLYQIKIVRAPDNILDLKEYRISLEWKNNGGSMATNVQYWMGKPDFVEYVTDDLGPALEYIRSNFSERIFRSEGNPGHLFVSPGATLSTDEFTLSKENLRLLFEKKKRLLVWCVVRYGSRLEVDDWFAEVAVWLNFVLETDPDKPLVEEVTPLPFRVAVLGYRYRESYDQKRDIDDHG